MLGEGTVLFVRMAPPTYSTLAAASVLLDSKKHDLHYSGTVFQAQDIHLL